MNTEIVIAVQSPRAPRPSGAYSQAVRVGPLLFVSGQGPFDPRTGAIVGEEISAQVRQTMANISAILTAAGASLGHVAKITAYLARESDFAEYDRVYAEFFPGVKPARTTVQAGTWEILVEIDAVAYLPHDPAAG